MLSSVIFLLKINQVKKLNLKSMILAQNSAFSKNEPQLNNLIKSFQKKNQTKKIIQFLSKKLKILNYFRKAIYFGIQVDVGDHGPFRRFSHSLQTLKSSITDYDIIQINPKVKMTKNQKGNKMEDHAYRPYVRDDNRKRRSNSYGKLNSFAWSKTEEFQYVEFLKNNKDHFYNVQERKKSKIFVAMSNYLKKRGPDQCRSHHQKMSLKYGSIDAIIQKITETKLAVITERSQQPNFSTQLKQVQSQYNSLVEISMQEDEKVDNQSQNLEMIEIQMDAPKQEAILWDYLNDNVWVNL